MYNACKSVTPGLDVWLSATVLAGDIIFCRIELYPGENFWRKINMQGLLCLSLLSGVPSLLPVGLHTWRDSLPSKETVNVLQTLYDSWQLIL